MALSNSERQRRWRDKRNLVYKVVQADRPSRTVLQKLSSRISKVLVRERTMSAAYEQLVRARRKEAETVRAAKEALADLEDLPNAGMLRSELIEQWRIAEKRGKELDVLIGIDGAELRTVRDQLKILRDSQRILGKR
jgi:hypothetical protein